MRDWAFGVMVGILFSFLWQDYKQSREPLRIIPIPNPGSYRENLRPIPQGGAEGFTGDGPWDIQIEQDATGKLNLRIQTESAAAA